MDRIVQNKDNLTQGTDQAAIFLGQVLADGRTKNQRETVDLIFTCIYYQNIINAVIANNRQMAEDNLINMVDVFDLPFSEMDKYLDLLFTDDSNTREDVTKIKEIGDGLILTSKNGLGLSPADIIGLLSNYEEVKQDNIRRNKQN